MIVGFTITDFKGFEQAAVEFIQKVCILEDPSIAQNIVDAGVGVNIFSASLTLEELQEQPFESTPIETQDGKDLIVSIVNFNLELLYNNAILRLLPTEYIYVEPSEVFQFETYLKQGLVRAIPDLFSSDIDWILQSGSWNDDNVWVDSAMWRDSDEQ